MQNRIRVGACVAIVLSFFAASFAAAQSQRTFVASTGNDANPCSRALPCRNFQAAITATLSGGEVVVLDSAGYGPVGISQSISLVAPSGVYAGITAFSGQAVYVAAPTATVVLRGLTLTGLGASEGIYATAYAFLHVENCEISGFTAVGLDATSAGELDVLNSVVRGGNNGIETLITAGTLVGSIAHCSIEHNTGVGIFVAPFLPGTAAVTISDTVMVGNQFGVDVGGGIATVTNCVATANTYGIGVVGLGATVVVSASTVANNTNGFWNNSGTFLSFGNNRLSGNTTQTSGTITPIAEQ